MLNTAYIGFPALQSWIVGGMVYLIGVAIIHKRADIKALLGFARI